MTHKIHQDVYIGSILILMAGFLYYEALSFNAEASIYPKGILTLFGALGLLISINGFRKTKKKNDSNNDSNEEFTYEGEESELTFSLIKNPFAVILMVIVYVILLNLLGFYSATALLTIGMLLFMGIKKWTTYVYTTLGILVFINLVFEFQLGVNLPTGFLI